MKILILEDEAKTANELCAMVERFSADCFVADRLSTVSAAIEWFSSNPLPDLIVSDIQLADGLSFSLFEHVPDVVPVIFCTAFDQYAIRAFETHGIDYLLKPIEEERLHKSLQKYEALKQLFGSVKPSGYEERFQDTMAVFQPRYRESVLVHYRDAILPVPVAEIAYVQSENGLVRVHTSGGKKYLISSSLDELEQTLNPDQFTRANRQYIVQRSVIESVQRTLTRRLTVTLKADIPERIIVSKARSGTFLKWLES